jgi:hypothetical protein
MPRSLGAIIGHNSIFDVLTGRYLNTPATAQHNAVSNASSMVLEADAAAFSITISGVHRPHFR